MKTNGANGVNMLEETIEFYIKLLREPATTSAFRANNQELYATVRDVIAKETGLSAEKIQTHFELHADLTK